MKRINTLKKPMKVVFNRDGHLTGAVQTWRWEDLAMIFGRGREKPIAGFEITANGLEVHFNDIQTVADSFDYRTNIINGTQPTQC